MTPNSLIILDEVRTSLASLSHCPSSFTFRSARVHRPTKVGRRRKQRTSHRIPTGLSLATSLTETLCRSQAFVIIATHFQQLTSVGYLFRNVANYHFDVVYTDHMVTEPNGSSHDRHAIVYSYSLRPGICKDLHYGRVRSPRRFINDLRSCSGLTLAGQIEDLQNVVELAKCVAKYYLRKKEVRARASFVHVIDQLRACIYLADHQSHFVDSQPAHETRHCHEGLLRFDLRRLAQFHAVRRTATRLSGELPETHASVLVVVR